jgi:2-dehydropantoate 2-reductase
VGVCDAIQAIARAYGHANDRLERAGVTRIDFLTMDIESAFSRVPERRRRIVVTMRIAILGAGAVGGYYGARLARAGHHVTFIARGAHLAAIRERGLQIRSPMLGDFVVHARAEEDTKSVGPLDLVIVAVKAYDNATALPLVGPMLGPGTAILTLQNGVDSVSELAALYGEEPVIGGTTYIATALAAPGLIEQTGTHRRIVFGEVFGRLPRLSDRVSRIHDALAGADVQSEAVEDGRTPIWEKFIFLATLAGFTGAARLPIGPVWADPEIRAQFLDGCREVERLARAEGVTVASDVIDRISEYVEKIPGTMRSSLLIDLSQGKRIEVEALLGSLVRRAARAGLDVPIARTLYAVLKPWAGGEVR